jgi:uncharacterized RDD family membrane protein YckC
MISPPPPGGYTPQPMGGAMAAGNLASPGLRIVGGLIDFIILIVINSIVSRIIFQGNLYGLSGIINLALDVGYFAYFWSTRGQSIGMMAFGFKVRDISTGQYPDMTKAALRGFIWCLEAGFTICLIGAVGWLWMLWDPGKQALHDKVAGTIVTAA